jgi:hypothetical protein
VPGNPASPSSRAPSFSLRVGRNLAVPLLGLRKLDTYVLIGNTFSQMAKFAQNQPLLEFASSPRPGAETCAGRAELIPKTTKGAPIQDALQKTGADLTIIGSAEKFLVTKAHVFCPFHSR